MGLEVTYLNERIELFDGVYDQARAAQLRGAVRLYNRTVGPITSVHLIQPENVDLSMYSAYCHHSPIEWLVRDLSVKNRPAEPPVPGGGKGATLLRPVLGALGEMAERLLGMLHFTSVAERVRYGSYADLVRDGLSPVSPGELPLFAPEQYARADFPFHPFEDGTWLGWLEGTRLMSGAPVWVPAQLVLMYYRPGQGESAIGYATTAGLAFQISAQGSVLHGLCEVIERDALNIRWYSKLPPARVDVELTGVLASELGVSRSRMATPDADVQIFDLTLDTPIPVFAAIAFDRAKTERAFLGGTGASFRREEALAQALFELGQCQTGFHFEDPFGRRPIYPDSDLADVVAFFDAPLYYGHRTNMPRTYWFADSPETIRWEQTLTIPRADEASAYEDVLDWLRERAIDPIVINMGDACPPGMSITKVYLPELTHACPPRDPMLGHPRFYELPQALGAAHRRLSFDDLNPDPIPFA